jgi:uncharacterized protein
MSEPVERLLPAVDDLDTGGFFAAAADGKLAILHCSNCDAVLHMPRAYCRACGSFAAEWRAVAPRGTIYSYTVVTHQVHPGFPVPYTLVLVDLDALPGVRLVGHLDGRPPVTIGQAVRADFERLAGDTVLPRWSLADA